MDTTSTPSLHCTQKGRDLRVDCLRGLALLVITSNHIAHNPFQLLTPSALQLADMAEMFLFLSGYVSGLTALKRRQTPAWMCLKFWQRAAQLFVAYLGTGILLIWLIRKFQLAGRVETISANLLSGSLSQVFSDLLLWNGRVSHLCILLLYVALLSALPVMLILNRFQASGLLSTSLVIYLVGQFGGLQLPEQVQQTMAFDPFAWQLIFMLGVAIGIGRLPPVFTHPASVFIALASLLLGLVWMTYFPKPPYWMISKSHLGFIRLLHFACAGIVIHAVLPPQFSFNARKWMAPLILCGQQSLATYCGGAILSVLVLACLPVRPSILQWILTNITLWAGCVAIAGTVSVLKRRLSDQKKFT